MEGVGVGACGCQEAPQLLDGQPGPPHPHACLQESPGEEADLGGAGRGEDAAAGRGGREGG